MRNSPPKNIVLVAGLTLIASTLSMFGGTLLYDFNFNTPGSSTVPNGSNAPGYSTKSGTMRDSSGTTADLYGAAGSGVSGNSSDYSFDNFDASNGMGLGNTGGRVGVGTAGLANLTSFTLSGWFNTDSTTVIGNNARLFDYGNSTYLSASKNGTLSLVINGTTIGSSSAAYVGTNTWIYFAVTYDGTNAVFYQGDISTAATSKGTITDHPGLTTGTSNLNMFLGNNASGSAPFKGLIDNFQIYGSTTDASGALSQSEIRTIQSAAVPEPKTAMLLSLTGALVLLNGKRFNWLMGEAKNLTER